MGVRVYGASDDCIEVDGDIYEEFYANREGNYLAFSNGSLLEIQYADDGIWRIRSLTGEIRVDACPPDDDDHYTDYAYIDADDVRWVMLGTDVAYRRKDTRVR